MSTMTTRVSQELYEEVYKSWLSIGEREDSGG